MSLGRTVRPSPVSTLNSSLLMLKLLRRPRAGLALFVALTASLLPPILASGAWLSALDGEEALERFDHKASLIALGVTDGVHELISLKIEVLNVTAGTLSAIKEWDLGELQALTDAQIISSGSFDSFYVGDTRGVSLVFAPSKRSDGTVTRAGVNYSDREYFKLLSASKRPAFGKLKRGKQSGVANVHVAVPIYQDLTRKAQGELRGYITAGLRPQLIEQVIGRILKGSEGLRALLMEQDGAVISDSDGSLAPLTPRPNATLYQHPCTGGAEPVAYLGRDERGRAVRALCTEVKLTTQRWQLWLSAPQAQINESAQRSMTLTVGVAGLLVLTVLGVATLLSLALTRLMSLISERAHRVAEGDFTVGWPEARWYSPRELVEVGEIVLKTLRRLRESDHTVRELVRDLEVVNHRQAPLVEAWRQVHEAIEIISLDGETLFANPKFYELLGLSEDEVRGGERSPLMSIEAPQGERTIGELVLGHALKRQEWTGEIEVRRAEMRQLHVVHSTPLFDDEGELTQVVVIRRDVTDERVAQAAAAHNDRLAAVGTLAAGMAHEINNPLMYIRTSLELIQEELEERGLTQELTEASDALNDASEGVDRVSHIVKSLLSIARSGGRRGQHEEMSPVSVSELVSACVNLVKAELGKRVTLEVKVPTSLSVWGRRSELIQVLLNLITNASQAMPQERAHQGQVRISARQGSTSEVLIAVQDNAGGISEEDLTHIFEPFFSSKPVGQGTGLGLSVSRGIIQAHLGTLEVSSVLGEGSCFTITLPTSEHAHQEELLAQLSPTPLLTPVSSPLSQALSPTPSLTGEEVALLQPLTYEQGRPLRILIVDDDVLVAKSLAKLLRAHEVTLSESASRALLELSEERFDLILSDVMMPEMDGPSFYQALVLRQPAYQDRLIFITGATKGDDVREALEATERPVLSKPVSRDQLNDTIQALTLKLHTRPAPRGRST